MLYFKKGTGQQTIEYHDALDEALCFGWVDSLVKQIDEDRYARKFTPRRANSRWSEINRRKAAKMIAEGRMTEAGLASLPRSSAAESKQPLNAPAVPDYLTRALKANTRAEEYFHTLAPSYRKKYLSWITGAKQQATRERRMAEAIKLLSQGKKLPLK